MSTRAKSSGVKEPTERQLLGLFLTPDGRLPAFAQRRLDGLLDKSKSDGLTRPERRELREMLTYVDEKSILLLRYSAQQRSRPPQRRHSA